MLDEQERVVLAGELMQSFRQVHRKMNQLMRVQADQLGITPVQLLVLRTLAEESDLSLSELADRVQLGCSTVSGVVKRLSQCDLVERDRLDEDQRTVAIRLSEKGRQLENKLFGEGSLLSKALMKFMQLQKQDIEVLLKLHQELIHIMKTESDKPY